MASKKNGLANWPAREHLSHPFSQGVVQQDEGKTYAFKFAISLNPFSQGVVRQDYWKPEAKLSYFRLNPFSQGVVRQDPRVKLF